MFSFLAQRKANVVSTQAGADMDRDGTQPRFVTSAKTAAEGKESVSPTGGAAQ